MPKVWLSGAPVPTHFDEDEIRRFWQTPDLWGFAMDAPIELAEIKMTGEVGTIVN